MLHRHGPRAALSLEQGLTILFLICMEYVANLQPCIYELDTFLLPVAEIAVSLVWLWLLMSAR